MKTMLLVGTVCAAAAAGVVYAARPADPPQAEPPRPAAVAKPDPAQQPKADKKADPGEQGAFTRNPRLGSTVDLALTEVREASWSSDGGALIVWGGSTDDRKQTHPDAKAVFGLTGPHPAADVFGLGVHPTATAVRFTPDGKSIFTDVRETQLVSGRHELHFTDLGRDPARQPGDVKRRMVTLDAQDTRGYAFAADGKTFRTVAYEPGRREPRYRDISVRSVDAATGKTLKTLLTVEGEFQRFALSPDGRRLGLFDAKWNLAVHDVDSAKLLWAKSLRDDDLGREVRHFLFSPDGMRLAAVGEDAPHVYDATTGKPLPKLQEADESGHDSPSFTADGRLLATSLPRGWHGSPPFICVWDCDTGKLVKRWAQRAQVAFHPTKPILAVLEPNGGQTRLGLWDFAAEVPKK